MGTKWKTGVLFAVVTILLGVVGTPRAVAQTPPMGPGWGSGQHLDPATLETVRGTVLEVQRSLSRSGAAYRGVHLLVETTSEQLTVDLGPEWYVDEQPVRVEAGDVVEIVGSRIMREGSASLVAVEVKKEEQILKLRHRDGTPLWSGKGIGQGPGQARPEARAGRRLGGVHVGKPCPRASGEPYVSGVIRDTSGLPVPGVSITVEPLGVTVFTDLNGEYCITEITEARAYELIAELPGFGRLVSEPVTLGQTARIPMDFVLAPEIYEEIVVTGTRTEKPLAEVPIRTELIAKPFIEITSARTVADVVEFTPGLRVENNCQNCNFSQIRLLGLPGPYTQILVEGQPSVSSLAQVYGIEQIPARMIERVEVVKGGGSALYGSGSVGGVVNIIPREPTATGGVVETRAELMGGLPQYSLSGAAHWVGADRQTLATVFGQLDWVKPIDVDGDGFTEVSSRRFQALGGRLSRFLLDGRAKLSADASRLAEDRRGGNLLRLPPHEADIAEWTDMTRHAGTVTWFHGVSPRFDYRLTVSFADTARDSYYGSGRDPNAYGVADNRLYVVDSQFNHHVGRHVLSWGGQFTSENLMDCQPAYGRLVEATYRSGGTYLQDDWSFNSKWELVYGFRIDKHSVLRKAVLSPRGVVKYSPRPGLNIRGSVARGFRAPQVFDEDLHITQVGGGGQVIVLDPNLREEKAANYTLGVEWTREMGVGQGRVEANVFYTGLSDLFHNVEADDPATGAFEFLRMNFGAAKVYGIELNAGWGMGDTLVLQGGFVAERARFAGREPDFGARDFFRTPDRYGTVTITYRNPNVADVFVGLRYTGSMRAPHYAGFILEKRLEVTDSFLTLDASIARTFTVSSGQRLVATLGAKNLTNAYQDDLDRGPDRDAGYVYGPRFPRAVLLSVRVEF